MLKQVMTALLLLSTSLWAKDDACINGLFNLVVASTDKSEFEHAHNILKAWIKNSKSRFEGGKSQAYEIFEFYRSLNKVETRDAKKLLAHANEELKLEHYITDQFSSFSLEDQIELLLQMKRFLSDESRSLLYQSQRLKYQQTTHINSLDVSDLRKLLHITIELEDTQLSDEILAPLYEMATFHLQNLDGTQGKVFVKYLAALAQINRKHKINIKETRTLIQLIEIKISEAVSHHDHWVIGPMTWSKKTLVEMLELLDQVPSQIDKKTGQAVAKALLHKLRKIKRFQIKTFYPTLKALNVYKMALTDDEVETTRRMLTYFLTNNQFPDYLKIKIVGQINSLLLRRTEIERAQFSEIAFGFLSTVVFNKDIKTQYLHTYINAIKIFDTNIPRELITAFDQLDLRSIEVDEMRGFLLPLLRSGIELSPYQKMDLDMGLGIAMSVSDKSINAMLDILETAKYVDQGLFSRVLRTLHANKTNYRFDSIHIRRKRFLAQSLLEAPHEVGIHKEDKSWRVLFNQIQDFDNEQRALKGIKK